MMWTADVNKEGFLSILSRRSQLQPMGLRSGTEGLQEPVPGGQIRLIWPEWPTNGDILPTAIVVAAGEQKDFIAWATTFLDGYRPFTSLCRVLEPTSLIQVTSALPQPSLGNAEAVSAALIIAEALTHSTGKLTASSLNLPSCESTYSFSRARLIALKVAGKEFVVAKAWQLARDVTRQPARVPPVEEIERLWNVVTDVALSDKDAALGGKGDGIVAAACRQLSRTGEVTTDMLGVLVPRDVDAISAVNRMRGTREERVLAFERTLEQFARRSGSMAQEWEFFCGYLASQLNPGSLEYVGLVTKYLGEFPTILMWYALCAGIHPESDVLGEFGGLGRRILRDVLMVQVPLARPRCDLSVEELQVITQKPGALQQLRLGQSNCATVELMPMVCTVLWLGASTASHQMGLFEGGPSADRFEQWIGELGRAVDELSKTYERGMVFRRDGSKRTATKRGRRKN